MFVNRCGYFFFTEILNSRHPRIPIILENHFSLVNPFLAIPYFVLCKLPLAADLWGKVVQVSSGTGCKKELFSQEAKSRGSRVLKDIAVVIVTAIAVVLVVVIVAATTVVALVFVLDPVLFCSFSCFGSFSFSCCYCSVNCCCCLYCCPRSADAAVPVVVRVAGAALSLSPVICTVYISRG